MTSPPETLTRCVVVGGGPAGMMAGYLLARAGVEVAVLEKHADFFRDFRGDTIHPSTLEVMHELGLLEAFLALPHTQVRELAGIIGGARIPIAGFALRMSTGVVGLIDDGGRVVGVSATAPDGPLEVRADLVVGADGRDSTVRAAAGLRVETLGAPMDVLWFRLPRKPGDAGQLLGRVEAGRIFIMLDRGDYWQCGFVIAKGTLDEIRARGLAAFRDEVAR